MFKLLCVCLFLWKYANAYDYYGYQKNSNDDEIKRKMLSYFETTSSSWKSDDSSMGIELRLSPYTKFQSPITIIQSPTIERTYRTEIMVQQASHPYLYSIMQIIPNKIHLPFQYVYQKLFKYYMALQIYYKPPYQINYDLVIQILRYVFPELGDKILEIAKYQIGPQMLRVLFQIIFPQLSPQDLELIFRNAQTTPEFIINLILYLCPNIQEHFLWNGNLPIDEKLNIIFSILFPGVPIHQILSNHPNNFPGRIYAFLEALFQGKLTLGGSNQPIRQEGPEWFGFQQVLNQYHLNYQSLPKEVLHYLYSSYKTPQFKSYVRRLKEKMSKKTKPLQTQMDQNTLQIWFRYLNDIKNHQKTFYDMPPEIKIFLQQNNNPQDFVKIISDTLGTPIDTSKLNTPLDPQIMQLWQKFIMDNMQHNGDVTHLPPELLNYFSSLSQNPNYKQHLDVIFNTLSINPQKAVEWNVFFDQLKDGHTSLDQMPDDLKTYLIKQKHPEDFLKIILKLKDSNTDFKYINVDTNPETMTIWKNFIEDVAKNKGNIKEIPSELRQYFFKISTNPQHAEYIKLLFSPDKINPKTLSTWNHFITDLQTHKVDLKDMPTELIQLMLKYNSPDEFFKVILPHQNMDFNINSSPDDTVKQQWKNWIYNIQNRNTSVYDTPQELKTYFHHVSPSKDYQNVFNQIYSINPDLLQKWKIFMNDLKQQKKSLYMMPADLKLYLQQMKSPKDFVNLIYKGLEHPLDAPIPAPSQKVEMEWPKFLQSLSETHNLDGDTIDSVAFPKDLSNYLQTASDLPNYKEDLNKIYQLDSSLKNEMDNFKYQLLNDYNVTLTSMPKKLIYFFYKFELPSDALRAILATYPRNYEITKNHYVPPDFIKNWLKNIEMIKNGNNVIFTSIKSAIMEMTQNTPLQSDIVQIFQTSDKNQLVTRLETIWRDTKNGSPVHDGLEVFLQFLDRFGKSYQHSDQLCEYRFRIVEALDVLKNRFSATCT